MIVLVVASGLVVVGCDAIWMKSLSLPPTPDRLSPDTVWVRGTLGARHVPLQRCDVREILLLGSAADPLDPRREVVDLAPLVFLPGDVNLDGAENERDLSDYFSGPYDYNLDGWVTGDDVMALVEAVYHPMLCE